VEQENTTEEVDIEKLNAHIAEIVIKQTKLRFAIDEIIADLEGGNV
jgi:type I restriction enzyme M protein